MLRLLDGETSRKQPSPSFLSRFVLNALLKFPSFRRVLQYGSQNVHFFLIGLIFADFFIFHLLNLSQRNTLITYALMHKLNKNKCSGSRGARKGTNAPAPIFFLPKNTFLATEFKRDK